MGEAWGALGFPNPREVEGGGETEWEPKVAVVERAMDGVLVGSATRWVTSAVGVDASMCCWAGGVGSIEIVP